MESCRIASRPDFYPDGHQLTDAYVTAFAPVVMSRLHLAGLRLAATLNGVLGAASRGTALTWDGEDDADMTDAKHLDELLSRVRSEREGLDIDDQQARLRLEKLIRDIKGRSRIRSTPLPTSRSASN